MSGVTYDLDMTCCAFTAANNLLKIVRVRMPWLTTRKEKTPPYSTWSHGETVAQLINIWLPNVAVIFQLPCMLTNDTSFLQAINSLKSNKKQGDKFVFVRLKMEAEPYSMWISLRSIIIRKTAFECVRVTNGCSSMMETEDFKIKVGIRCSITLGITRTVFSLVVRVFILRMFFFKFLQHVQSQGNKMQIDFNWNVCFKMA